MPIPIQALRKAADSGLMTGRFGFIIGIKKKEQTIITLFIRKVYYERIKSKIWMVADSVCLRADVSVCRGSSYGSFDREDRDL